MRECPECGTHFPEGTEECPDDGASLVAEGSDPYIGKPVGSYMITRCLGRGGMGAVYQADHPSIGSKVAVKFLHRRFSADRAIVERFFNEARAVNMIGHDNIVKISDFSQLDDGSPYFLMEFLEGQGLTAFTGAPQPLGDMGPIFLQVADGLQAAHEKGIIHRDLKPDNIFLVTRGRRANFVKIVDFGIAKLQGTGATGRTQTGMVMGTAQYMSPEQAGGEVNKICPASDVYSVGVIMFQLATGQMPFEGSNFGEILVGHLMKTPPKPRSIEPSIPEVWEEIILRCLAKKPEDRYETAAELYEALADALDGLGLSREPPLARTMARPDGGARVDSRPPLATPPTSQPGGTLVGKKAGGSNPPQKSTRPTPEGKGGTVLMHEAAPTAVMGAREKGYTPQKKGSLGSSLALAGGIVVVGGLAVALLMGRGETPEPPPAPAVEAKKEPAEKAPEPPPVTTVGVTIVSNPPGAKLALVQAGKRFDAVTPATVTLQRGAPVAAKLEAEGFTTLDEAFTPEKDVELRYVLVAVPAVAAKPVVEKKPDGKAPDGPKTKKPSNVGDGMVDVDF